MVTVAIISDTHGALDGRIAERIAGAEYCIHAGDIGSQAVYARVLELCGQVIAVRGNNDVIHAETQAWLEPIPWRARLQLPGGEIAVEHGHRAGPLKVRHGRLRRRYPQARAIVCGHSHHAACDDMETPWVLNPGACGRSRTYGGPGCLLLRAEGPEWSLEVHRFPRAASTQRVNR